MSEGTTFCQLNFPGSNSNQNNNNNDFTLSFQNSLYIKNQNISPTIQQSNPILSNQGETFILLTALRCRNHNFIRDKLQNSGSIMSSRVLSYNSFFSQFTTHAMAVNAMNMINHPQFMNKKDNPKQIKYTAVLKTGEQINELIQKRKYDIGTTFSPPKCLCVHGLDPKIDNINDLMKPFCLEGNYEVVTSKDEVAVYTYHKNAASVKDFLCAFQEHFSGVPNTYVTEEANRRIISRACILIKEKLINECIEDLKKMLAEEIIVPAITLEMNNYEQEKSFSKYISEPNFLDISNNNNHSIFNPQNNFNNSHKQITNNSFYATQNPYQSSFQNLSGENSFDSDSKQSSFPKFDSNTNQLNKQDNQIFHFQMQQNQNNMQYHPFFQQNINNSQQFQQISQNQHMNYGNIYHPTISFNQIQSNQFLLSSYPSQPQLLQQTEQQQKQYDQHQNQLQKDQLQYNTQQTNQKTQIDQLSTNKQLDTNESNIIINDKSQPTLQQPQYDQMQQQNIQQQVEMQKRQQFHQRLQQKIQNQYNQIQKYQKQNQNQQQQSNSNLIQSTTPPPPKQKPKQARQSKQQSHHSHSNKQKQIDDQLQIEINLQNLQQRLLSQQIQQQVPQSNQRITVHPQVSSSSLPLVSASSSSSSSNIPEGSRVINFYLGSRSNLNFFLSPLPKQNFRSLVKKEAKRRKNQLLSSGSSSDARKYEREMSRKMENDTTFESIKQPAIENNSSRLTPIHKIEEWHKRLYLRPYATMRRRKYILARKSGLPILKSQFDDNVNDNNAKKGVIGKRVYFEKSEIQGYGLFALEPISTKDFICEYTGQLIRMEVADRREKKLSRKGFQHMYLFRLGQMVIDATQHGSNARFLNHSCSPNCKARQIEIKDMQTISFFASKPIKPHDEIAFDYEMELERDPSKWEKCYCGSKDCNGYLNYSVRRNVLNRMWMQANNLYENSDDSA